MFSRCICSIELLNGVPLFKQSIGDDSYRRPRRVLCSLAGAQIFSFFMDCVKSNIESGTSSLSPSSVRLLDRYSIDLADMVYDIVQRCLRFKNPCELALFANSLCCCTTNICDALTALFCFRIMLPDIMLMNELQVPSKSFDPYI